MSEISSFYEHCSSRRVVAQNDIGMSGPSDTVTIETAEESPSGPPVDIRVAPVDQHTLRVSWKPPLTEHWNGDILGYYVGYKKTSDGEEKPYYFETVEFIKEEGHEHQLQVWKRTRFGVVMRLHG